MHHEDGPENRRQLSRGERWLAGIVGLLLAIGSFFVFYFPPEIQAGASGQAGSRHVDASLPFTSMLATGATLLLYTINGMRFTKFSAAGVSVETENPTRQAQDYLSTRSVDEPDRKIHIEEPEGPEAGRDAPQVETTIGEFKIFSIATMPIRIIEDALHNWPEQVEKPQSLAEFEWGARRTGKGNHAWYVKFKDRPEVAVAYGGQGKSDPTVSESE